MKFKILNSNKGFVVSIVTFFVLIIMLSIALSMSALVFYRQQVITNEIKSTQSYYAAEAGMEDALIRLNDNPQISSLSYILNVGDATAEVSIPNILAGSRVITSNGDYLTRKRNLRVVYSINSEGISFHYGAQVDVGGLTMNNGSRVEGNVFSNGNISGGTGTITNNVVVAGNGHSIKDITVGGNALAHSCLSPATIEGSLTYVTGGTITCTVQGSTSTQPYEIATQPLPISQSQIDQWETEAAAGGTISGSFLLDNGATQSLGPVKITGNLTISNNSILNITGTIHVLGDVLFDNNSTVRLASCYGSLGGMVIADGKITTKNNAVLRGSGQEGSYLLVISTSALDQAILIDNNATGAIFYTNNGGIEVKNNVEVKELTGYKIKLDNNAIISYDIGLVNTLFSSGPSGDWEVASWGEQ